MPLQLNIPAGSLANGLDKLGDQAGVQIMYEPSLARDIQVAAVTGTLTVSTALEKLLAQTGLRADRVNDKTVVLKPAEDKKATVRLAYEAPTTNRSPQDSSSTFDEVVVSAQKKGEERLQDTPIPIAVINTDTLTTTDTVLLRDYYTSVPGLTLTQDTSLGQEIGIRGIWENAETPTVAVLIDNVPFSSSAFAGGAVNAQVDIDPGDLARVEVLRGPQGTLYGSSAMGGVLRYVTKDPSTGGFGGRIEAGTNDVYNGAEPGFNLRGSVNLPVTDTLAVRASAFVRQDAGYIDNVVQHVRGINEVEVYGTRSSALWKPSETVYLKLSATYQNTRGNGLSDVVMDKNGYSGPNSFASAFPPEIAAILFPTPGNLQQNDVGGVDRYRVTTQLYAANLKLKLGAVDFSSDTGYTIQRSVAPFDFTPFLGPTYIQSGYAGYGAPMSSLTQLNKLSEEIRLSGHIGPNLDWVLGGFYSHESESPQQHQTIYIADAVSGNSLSPFPFYDGNANDRFSEYAGFANITYRFTNRFDIQAGVREGHTKESFILVAAGPYFGTTDQQVTGGDASSNSFTYLFTPRLKLSQDIMAYIRIASGFRPGGGNPLPPALGAGIPTSFSPDKTYNYEVGLKGDFLDRRLSIDTSVYHIDWKGMQIQEALDGFGYIENGGSAKSEGVELSFQARPLTGLTLSGWVDYDHAVLTSNFPLASTAYGVTGDELPATPKYSAQLSVQQDISLSSETSAFLSAVATYVGDRLSKFPACGASSTAGTCAFAPRDIYPSYTKTDLHAGVEHNSWTASLYVNNVANVRGITSGGLGYFTPYVFFVTPPRTIGLSVSKSF